MRGLRAAAVGCLALAACGGGGGGGVDDQCPPGSAIAIYPPSLRVTAGTEPVAFGGGVSNCTADSHWSLAGPGSIDRTTGVPVHYTPPASVAAMATATLTMRMGGLSTSAPITIDPASMTLHGRVMTVEGMPVASAQVKVGTSTATADADGSFALPEVSPPYDLSASSADGLLTSVYPGLRTAAPTLMLFEGSPSYLPTTWLPTRGTNGGWASGSVSGGAGYPEPSGHVTAVTFHSPEASAASVSPDGAGAFHVQAAWSGASTTAGVLHALQWSVDASGLPASFDGHASRSGVVITASQDLTGQELALAAVATQALSGSTGDGSGAGLAARAVFSDGTWLRFVPPPGSASFFGGPGTPTFAIPTPAVAGATIDLVARRDYAGWAYQEVHRHGLAPDATDLALTFGGLPQPHLPPDGAVGVGAGTTFDWYVMAGFPVYVVSFRPGTGAPAGSPSFDVLVAGTSLTIPAGTPFPRNAPYTWRVSGSTAFTLVDEAAGPDGFLAAAPAYVVAQGTPARFTTAP